MSAVSLRRVAVGLRLEIGSVGKVAQSAKQQPWKAFWPLKAESYTSEERANMPWLTWKFDPANPTNRPWRKWMLDNQSTVVRRGSW